MDGATENLHFSLVAGGGTGSGEMRKTYEIDTFFLYGEPPRPAGDRFAHLEEVEVRSRPANWRIEPHAHADLHHVFHISQGGGVIHADGAEIQFAAPQIIFAPAGAVHGFHWAAETAGRILTFSDAFFRTIAQREPALAAMAAGGVRAAPLHDARLAEAMAALGRELSWQSVGHDTVVEAQLSVALVEALRALAKAEHEAHTPPGPHALLVARYRQLIETHFRAHPSVEWCAAELGVSAGRLRLACRRVTGLSPGRILQSRLALEAQRVMRYSDMTIAEVAHDLGFSDPAYFSRFFSRECGSAPRRFRVRTTEQKTEEA